MATLEKDEDLRIGVFVCDCGLNIAGVCHNPNCKVPMDHGQKKVIMSCGFKPYHNSINKYDVRCPICKYLVRADSAIVSRCFYRVDQKGDKFKDPLERTHWKRHDDWRQKIIANLNKQQVNN